MNETVSSITQDKEFDKLLAESINKSNIKEGTIIQGTISEIENDAVIVDIGAKPVFCDVSEETYNIDPSKVEELITKKTKVILCVHLFGHPADVKSLKEICKKNQIYLVEDCAQAHGAEYDKKKCGDFGDVSAFSFYPTKILGGFGDGGLVYSNSKEIDDPITPAPIIIASAFLLIFPVFSKFKIKNLIYFKGLSNLIHVQSLLETFPCLL